MGGRCCRSSVPVLSMSFHPRTGQSQMWGGDIFGVELLLPCAESPGPGSVCGLSRSCGFIPFHSTHLISLFLGHSLTPTMIGLTDSGRRKQELRRACDSHLHFISGTRGPEPYRGTLVVPPACQLSSTEPSH